MFPVPHILLFVPICVFAGLAIAAAATQFIATIVPSLGDAHRADAARPSAQIYYFTPRKTPLRSHANHGGRHLALPRR